jgi:EAL domain-containing protein (putative c-di-GMP-specific phosphodiesterase class I)
MTHEHEMEADLVRAAAVQKALDTALLAMPQISSLEDAAQTLCDALSGLPAIDLVAVFELRGQHEVVTVGLHAPPDFLRRHGSPSRRDAGIHERAHLGPWVEAWVPAAKVGAWGRALTRMGTLATSFWPITLGNRAVGVVAVATADERLAGLFLAKGPRVLDLGTTPSALLAERLQARAWTNALRRSLAHVLAEKAFHPVYQPIVDLESREIVGFEALTRFDYGRDPDQCFADAWSVGLGPDLEIATLQAAVLAAKNLPSGKQLNLNISPLLLADPGRLGGALRSADRPLALEITEHDLIGDYPAVRGAVRGLGSGVRLAVDDAGAGIANFSHIVELRPDFVKLDISLVHGVSSNLARQALVVGMRHFSRTAGCRLVAEGIETEEDATTLRDLGVEFGQGYLFGRPARVEQWGVRGSPRAPDGSPTSAEPPQRNRASGWQR